MIRVRRLKHEKVCFDIYLVISDGIEPDSAYVATHDLF